MNVNLLYLNLSTACLPYRRNSPNSNLFQQAYSATRAQAYAQSILGSLAPPIGNWNPLTQYYVGIQSTTVMANRVPDSSYGGAGSYIAGYLPAPLFTNPVGNDQATANADGQIPYSRFRQYFYTTLIGQINNDFGNAATPIFSIIDHDGAHHITALLAERAFTAANSVAQRRARVILNFDYHSDYGASTGLPIGCGTWGVYTTQSVAGGPAVPSADAYIWLGFSAAPANWGQTQWAFPSGNVNTMQAAPGANAATPLAAQMTNIRNVVMNTALPSLNNQHPTGVDVYITVDRDFMMDSGTPWTDGAFAPAAAWPGVQQCMTYFRAAPNQCVGFDLTGMPVLNGKSRNLVSPADQMTQAGADVATFGATIQNL